MRNRPKEPAANLRKGQTAAESAEEIFLTEFRLSFLL